MTVQRTSWLEKNTVQWTKRAPQPWNTPYLLLNLKQQ